MREFDLPGGDTTLALGMSFVGDPGPVARAALRLGYGHFDGTFWAPERSSYTVQDFWG